jgi:hypothetical protein
VGRRRQAALGGHGGEGFDLLQAIHGIRLCIKTA